MAARLLALGTLGYAGASVFFDHIRATTLWTQTQTIPAAVVITLSVVFSVCLLVGPKIWPAGYRATRPLAMLLAVVSFADAMVWLRMWGNGQVQAHVPVPIGALTGALLILWIHAARVIPIPVAVRTQRDLWNKVLDRAYP